MEEFKGSNPGYGNKCVRISIPANICHYDLKNLVHSTLISFQKYLWDYPLLVIMLRMIFYGEEWIS